MVSLAPSILTDNPHNPAIKKVKCLPAPVIPPIRVIFFDWLIFFGNLNVNMRLLCSHTTRRILFSVIWLGISFLSPAQQTSFNFRHLTLNDGLSDGIIRSLTQDKYGFIWIGTSYGLNRFDGTTIKKFFATRKDSTTLTDNYIQSLYSDSKGRLLIGTRTGLCRYDYNSGRIMRYRCAKSMIISDIKEDRNGETWLATGDGLYQITASGDSIAPYTIRTDSMFRKKFTVHMYQMLVAPGGQFYFATTRGIKIFNPLTNAYKEIRSNPADQSSLSADAVVTMGIDSSGNLWAVCLGDKQELNKVDLHNFQTSRVDYFTRNAELEANNIHRILIDRKGNLWASSSHIGLTMLDIKSDRFYDYKNNPSAADGLLFSQTTCMYQDRDGIIWLGSGGYGVTYFHPEKNLFSSIYLPVDKKNSITETWCRAATEDKFGNLWLGSGKGVAKYNSLSNSLNIYANEPNKKPKLHLNSVRSLLADDNGDIWIGTARGLNRYSARNGEIDFFNRKQGIPLSFFWMMAKGHHDETWIGSAHGLFRYQRDKNSFDNLQQDSILAYYARHNIQALFVDSRNRLWAGLLDKGIMMYDPASRKTRLLTVQDSLVSDTRTSSFAEDRTGVIWIGSENGLTAYNPVRNTSRIYTREDGLPSDRTNNLMVDKYNRLWLGTSNGLCMLDKDRKSFKRFDMNDGLPTNQFNEQSGYCTREGLFIFPTYSGFVIFRPEAYGGYTDTVPVYITSFKVFGKELPTVPNPESLQSIRLRAGQNFFSIGLAGLNYMNSLHCTYAYMLEPFDKEWIYTNKREISYTNVPAGDYRFRYKVFTDNTGKNVQEKLLAISIAPVFYKTWWFRSLLIALTIAGLLGFYFLRMRQREKIYLLQTKAQSLEKEKVIAQYENLKQQLNPHFLFNSLTSLRSLIRIDKQNAAEFLDKMSLTYRYILKNSENELVSLSNEIEFVQTYIDLQKTRFGNGLLVDISISEECMYKKIVPVTLQNLMENAIKHNLIDHDTPLKVDIFSDNDYVVVRNNLQRKAFVEASNKYGLQQMLSLYKYLDPRPVEIVDDTKHFTVKIPLI